MATPIARSPKSYKAPAARPAMLLVAFMRFLIDNGLLGREAPVGDEQWLDELTVVSSCMAIAGRLGLEHGYMFKGLWHGAQSERMWDEFDGGGGRGRGRAQGSAGPRRPCRPALTRSGSCGWQAAGISGG